MRRPLLSQMLFAGLACVAVSAMVLIIQNGSEPAPKSVFVPAPPSVQISKSGGETYSDLADPDPNAFSPPRVEEPAAPLPDQIRNVSPKGITTPRVTGPLTRLEPANTVTDQSGQGDLTERPNTFVLKRPQVPSAGEFTSGALHIRLAHIASPEPGKQCKTRDGTPWPCGAQARTALRGLIRLNSIQCERIEQDDTAYDLATCKRGPVDIGQWLVEQGWAVPLETAPEPYHRLAGKALEERKGQWAEERSVPPLAAEPAQDGFSPGGVLSGQPADLPLIDDATTTLFDIAISPEPEAPANPDQAP